MKKTCFITYMIDTERGRYLVSMERLKNTKYGQPRFSAVITKILDFKYNDICNNADNCCRLSYRYNYTGHYWQEMEEAEYIVRKHEEEQDK